MLLAQRQPRRNLLPVNQEGMSVHNCCRALYEQLWRNRNASVGLKNLRVRLAGCEVCTISVQGCMHRWPGVELCTLVVCARWRRVKPAHQECILCASLPPLCRSQCLESVVSDNLSATGSTHELISGPEQVEEGRRRSKVFACECPKACNPQMQASLHCVYMYKHVCGHDVCSHDGRFLAMVRRLFDCNCKNFHETGLSF